MPEDIEGKTEPETKSHQGIEQQQDRYRAQQKAQLKTPLGESLMNRAPSSEATQPESTETIAGRSPAKIADRLQTAQAKMGTVQVFTKGRKAVSTIKKTDDVVQHLRKIYRIINGASAVTLVGLIVTVVVMNGQLILGNLFKFKRVPSLSLIEIIIIGVLDLLTLAFLLIILLFFVIIVAVVEDPWELVKLFPELGWDVFKSLFD